MGRRRGVVADVGGEWRIGVRDTPPDSILPSLLSGIARRFFGTASHKSKFLFFFFFQTFSRPTGPAQSPPRIALRSAFRSALRSALISALRSAFLNCLETCFAQCIVQCLVSGPVQCQLLRCEPHTHSHTPNTHTQNGKAPSLLHI